MRIITHKYNCSYKILCISILFILLKSNCGNAPQEPPAPEAGSIKITANLETLPVDSMLVLLDNDSIGIKPNPCIVTDIVAGKHQVAIFKDDPQSVVDFSSSPKLVAVNKNDTTDVTFALTKLAPNFTLKKLKNDESVTLADCQGKVVLLVFYSLG
ncbi:MAG TPA: hypothetical protein VGD14_20210 [bacterium]